ncbi:c-type cytochrome [Dethiobacter alkaliphilus]|uniref:Cytochrome c domain-containing protein n=1 Tax=Dethiobacter alkaliphilus AHT 1 TaxID=555088 RepID=C0GEQ6_DETAL|nr:cytochrome c [Dethiobacter alkaliphilus]EEG78088.1 hypothetical protein DealDRAFT_0965 [Dethiobacter alkaliphilus AHT 1]
MFSKKSFVLFLLLALVTVFAIGCGDNTGNYSNEDNNEEYVNGENNEDYTDGDNNNEVLPALTGAELVEERCSQCHGLDQVYRERGNWPATVDRMVDKRPGLLDDDEYDLVVEYLEENYGN